MEKLIKIIKEQTGDSKDLIIKEYNISNKKMYIVFIETLCDTNSIDEFALSYFSYIKIHKKVTFNLYKYIKEFIPAHNVKCVNNEKELINYLYYGFAAILINKSYYVVEFKRSLDSGINKCENEKTIKGPKDGFTENYQTNIGLIRKRIRSDSLWLDEVTIGEKSNTKIGIMYVDGIVDKNKVKEIKKKISNIKIDSIVASNYVYEYLKENDSLFPSVLSTERPDLVSYKLLSGKIAVIVENSPFVLLFPAFFMEFFHTMDDYYQNAKNSTYMRIIRIISFVISTMLPGIYIALITYNHEIITPELLVNFAMQKDGVPFPTILEAVFMNITFEIIRETDTRTPSTLGSALSIVGALVLGDAAVQAGLVSPIMVIVIAITAISELIFISNDVANPIKIWRLVFIFFASISGMIGVFISVILLIAELSSIKSIGYPYLYPLSPFDKDDQGNDIVLNSKYKMQYRNKLTASKNIIRGHYEK